MVTQHEATNLKHDMRQELAGAAGAMWKCTAGITLVLALTLVGSNVGLGTGAEQPVAQAAMERQP